MRMPTKQGVSVGLGTKHDKKPRRKAENLTNHPAMKELSRMIESGEVSRDRTLAYLTKGRKP